LGGNELVKGGFGGDWIILGALKGVLWGLSSRASLSIPPVIKPSEENGGLTDDSQYLVLHNIKRTTMRNEMFPWFMHPPMLSVFR